MHIRVTRPSEYGERYKLFVINKNSFEKKYTLENYGINLIEDQNRILVDTIQWNGLAKKNKFGKIKIIRKRDNFNGIKKYL